MDDRIKDILRVSVTSGTLKNVQDTFNRHALVQDESFFDYELLKAAFERKHISIINYLLKLGCRVRNPKTVNSELETALHLAMKVNNIGIIKKMLKNGASIDDKNHNGETALYAAFIGGYVSAVDEALTFVSTSRKQLEDLLDCNFIGLDPTNVDNIRHFQIACVTDHEAAVRYYLKYKFDVNNPLILNSATFFGSNPLHYATLKHCTQCIAILLERGADISIKNSNGKTPLQIIYYSNFSHENIWMIEQIFHFGNHTKFINSVDNNDVSHFHMSCAINYSEYAQVFIDNGVDVNRPISTNCSKYPGYTPLHIAVMRGCEKVIQLLLENGADCKERSTDGTTPLHLACKLPTNKVKFFIIKMLLKYNACPAAVDKNNCTPLHLSFTHINLFEEKEIFDIFISKIPREINFTDNEGLSHFHIVCVANDTSRIKDFLESGVDVNSCVLSKMFSGYTALHFAVLYNQRDAVEELLKWNAQVNIQTNNSQLTPLHLACNFDRKKFLEMEFRNKSTEFDWDSNRKNQLDIIKLLLLQGANVESQDSLGATPLFSTCKLDTFFYNLNPSEINERIKQIIKILLLNKANLNACTNNQESILHIISENVCLYDIEELVEYLLTKGVNIHAKNNAGFTPLHVAVKSCKTDLVKIFLKHQADVNAKSKYCLIPLQMIVKHNKRNSYEAYIDSSLNAIATTLLENDSYVNVRNINSKTLLQTAIESQNICITRKLLYCGADINMEDKFGISPVCCLFKWHTWDDYESFAIIFQITFIHIQKLLALGHYVSEKVQSCFIKLRQSYENILHKESVILKTHGIVDLDNVFYNCLEELDKMKFIKIDNYTSLYNILIKDIHEISRHVRNSTLVQILEDPNVDNNFPFYSFLLKLKYKKGLKRNDVLKLAEEALQRTIKLNLPDLCYDSVLKYLSNEDIINLKAAVSINNYKRKLSSDDSCETEPSTKLTKKL